MVLVRDVTYAFDDLATACRTESLDGVILALLHLRLVIVLDKTDRFATVDLIRVNRVPTEILNGLD